MFCYFMNLNKFRSPPWEGLSRPPIALLHPVMHSRIMHSGTSKFFNIISMFTNLFNKLLILQFIDLKKLITFSGLRGLHLIIIPTIRDQLHRVITIINIQTIIRQITNRNHKTIRQKHRIIRKTKIIPNHRIIHTRKIIHNLKNIPRGPKITSNKIIQKLRLIKNISRNILKHRITKNLPNQISQKL